MPSANCSASLRSHPFSWSNQRFSSDKVTISVVTSTMKAGRGSISREIESRSDENDSTATVLSTVPDENVEQNEESATLSEEERQAPHENDAGPNEKEEEREEKEQGQEEIVEVPEENEKETDENDEAPEEIVEVVTEFEPYPWIEGDFPRTAGKNTQTIA